MIFQPRQKIFLSPQLPGDKSLSHRALIFGSLSSGTSEFYNVSQAQDVVSTKNVLQALGVEISRNQNTTKILGKNKKLNPPGQILNCGNAGTLMRLIMGVLAGQNFPSILIGDESLSKRPMSRVSEPLVQMGAKIKLQHNNFSPVEIVPSEIMGGEIEIKMASAQVKSAVLLAGLFADKNDTILTGKIHSRDHTERFLEYFGADIFCDKNKIILKKQSVLRARNGFVPNDISAAAFWIACGVLAKEGEVVLENVGLNPSRMGFIDVLKKAGASIDITLQNNNPEPVGQIRVRPSKLKAFEIEPSAIASLIDEIPLLALLATQSHGLSRILGAEELRYKESDRLLSTQKTLVDLGAQVEIHGHDLIIEGPQKLRGGKIETFLDHRIAMMAAVSRFACVGEVDIDEVSSAQISDPLFMEQMSQL